MKGFNLKSIRQLPSAEVAIKDIDGNPTGVVFEIAGPEHPERKRITYALARRGQQRFNKTGRPEMLDPEEMESMKAEHLAAYTLGWTGYVDESGTPVAFSKATALALYQDPEMAWLVDQLDAALANKELFIKRSATT